MCLPAVVGCDRLLKFWKARGIVRLLVIKLLDAFNYLLTGFWILALIGIHLYTIVFAYKVHGIIAAIATTLFVGVSQMIYFAIAWGRFSSIVNPYSTEIFISFCWFLAFLVLSMLISTIQENLKSN